MMKVVSDYLLVWRLGSGFLLVDPFIFFFNIDFPFIFVKYLDWKIVQSN